MEHRATIEDIERLSTTDRNSEVIRGELIEVPPDGFDHGDIALAIGADLHQYARHSGIGRVAGAATSYILSEDPAVMLAPDALFVVSDRLPPREVRCRFLALPPDLAVEVFSPGDSASYVQRKVVEYLNFGVRLIWIVDLVEQTVAVYNNAEGVRFPGIDDELVGEDVLPGFSVPVAEIFA